MTLRLGMIRTLALGTVVLGATSLQAGPAAAQGGIVCSYGPASYRACCRQSYARNPRLGGRARANDIDACMNGGSSRRGRAGKSRSQDDD